MSLRLLLPVAVLLAVTPTLAGCLLTGGGALAGPRGVDRCPTESCGGQSPNGEVGAISGLVVDDRYRPVMQATALLLPLGIQATTNSDGEFGFLDIPPGMYTVQIHKEDHEALAHTIGIEAGQFTELLVEARRVAGSNPYVLVQEYAVFIPCAFDAVVTGGIDHCGTDLSGENARFRFTANYTEVPNATWLLVEAHIEQKGGWTVQVRQSNGEKRGGERYGIANLQDTDYARLPIRTCPETNPHPTCPPEADPLKPNQIGPWRNDGAVDTLLFLLGEHAGTFSFLNPALEPFAMNADRGIGVRFGIRAHFVHSIFVGEPGENLDEYGLLR